MCNIPRCIKCNYMFYVVNCRLNHVKIAIGTEQNMSVDPCCRLNRVKMSVKPCKNALNK